MAAQSSTCLISYQLCSPERSGPSEQAAQGGLEVFELCLDIPLEWRVEGQPAAPVHLCTCITAELEPLSVKKGAQHLSWHWLQSFVVCCTLQDLTQQLGQAVLSHNRSSCPMVNWCKLSRGRRLMSPGLFYPGQRLHSCRQHFTVDIDMLLDMNTVASCRFFCFCFLFGYSCLSYRSKRKLTSPLYGTNINMTITTKQRKGQARRDMVERFVRVSSDLMNTCLQ